MQAQPASDDIQSVADYTAQPYSDPLAECLSFLSRTLGRPLSKDAIRSGMPLVDDRLTPNLFVRAAERAGYSARILKRPLKKIPNLLLPAVLLLGDDQACVLLSTDRKKKTAQVAYPESNFGETEVDLKELERTYNGYAIFVQQQFRFDARAPELLSLRTRHWFWGTLFRSWRIYRDVLVASLLINLFALASPLFIMNVYDRVVPNSAVETLWVLAAGVATVYGFDFLMRMLRGYFIDIAGKKADIAMSATIFAHVMGLKLSARPASVGAFANNLREFESIRDFITSATVTTLIDLPFMFLFLAVIAYIGGPIVLVPAIAIPIVLFYGLIIQAPLRRAIENTFRASSQKSGTLVEGLVGMDTIKFLGAESIMQRKWESTVGYIAKWGVRSRILSTSAVSVATVAQQLATVGIVVFGVYLIAQASLTMGGLIACVILTGRAMAPMGQVASLGTRYYQAKVALQSLNDLMRLPVDRPVDKTFLSRPLLKGEIEFDSVNFSYPLQEQSSLDNVSFRIQPGERVAIIGRIGAGKTTVLKLIQGGYEATSGAVRIDGIDIKQIDPADLRHNIGYVPQDVTLFYGSVRDNIVLGSPHVDDETILHVAELTGVSEFAHRHPLGFDMAVGERGEGLSGGQRQTIAVARALLRNPSILLMDEPSNSMDNSSEARLRGRLAEIFKGKTVIISTHRASLLDLVDRVIVLDRGRVVADGKKAQVLEALQAGRIEVARN